MSSLCTIKGPDAWDIFSKMLKIESRILPPGTVRKFASLFIIKISSSPIQYLE